MALSIFSSGARNSPNLSGITFNWSSLRVFSAGGRNIQTADVRNVPFFRLTVMSAGGRVLFYNYFVNNTKPYPAIVPTGHFVRNYNYRIGVNTDNEKYDNILLNTGLTFPCTYEQIVAKNGVTINVTYTNGNPADGIERFEYGIGENRVIVGCFRM